MSFFLPTSFQKCGHFIVYGVLHIHPKEPSGAPSSSRANQGFTHRATASARKGWFTVILALTENPRCRKIEDTEGMEPLLSK
jgi:hypothetical protein